MSVQITQAKNGILTCLKDGLYLHSSYNPENEAQRFVDSIQADFVPENIFVIEPALSYCSDFLRKRFPGVKIFAIRFDDFSDYDNLWDKVFCFDENFSMNLYNSFGEEKLFSSLFVSWPPSVKAYPELNEECSKTISAVMKKCRDILGTRQYFASRWIKNQVNFFSSLNKTALIQNGSMPVILCGSGPSLKGCINFIRQNRNSFFVLAASSSIKVLISNGIIPDLCITTDGGYWAKKHLYCIENSLQDILVACPSESALSKKILFNNTIVPLCYDDNIDLDFYKKLNIKPVTAKRNGTVTGTALELALSITDGNVYLTGVDLCSSKGYVHTQPNELEIENSLKDKKFNPKEKRLCTGSFESASLEIYRNWFIENSAVFCSRVFRISNNQKFKNSLGKIKDIDIASVQIPVNTVKPEIVANKKSDCNLNAVIELFNEKLNDEKWIASYFPADFLSIGKETDSKLKKEKESRLKEKLDSLKLFLNRMNGINK